MSVSDGPGRGRFTPVRSERFRHLTRGFTGFNALTGFEPPERPGSTNARETVRSALRTATAAALTKLTAAALTKLTAAALSSPTGGPASP